MDPYGTFWAGYASPDSERQVSPGREMRTLLTWGIKNQVITDGDRSLLLCLVEAADRAASQRDRGWGGLLANDVSEVVARQWGIGASTVRRRARESVDALASACAETGGRFPDQSPRRWVVSSRDADS